MDELQVKEIKHCAEDFAYFCESYVKIIHPVKGLISLKLFPFQKRFIEECQNHGFVIGSKFRQGGFTTTGLAFCLWQAIFKTDQRILFITGYDRDACYCSRLVKNMIDQLPEWMQPNMGKNNDHEREFTDTNSRLSFITPTAARSRACTFMFIDDAAFIRKMDEHWPAMWPCLSTGSRLLVLSTINNKECWFQKILDDAREKKNAFHVFESHYSEHPDFTSESWTKEMRSMLGEKSWQQEMEQQCVSVVKKNEVFIEG